MIQDVSANLSKKRTKRTKSTKKIELVLRKYRRGSNKMPDSENFQSYYILVTCTTTNDYGKEKESEESRGTGKEECR